MFLLFIIDKISEYNHRHQFLSLYNLLPIAENWRNAMKNETADAVSRIFLKYSICCKVNQLLSTSALLQEISIFIFLFPQQFLLPLLPFPLPPSLVHPDPESPSPLGKSS